MDVKQQKHFSAILQTFLPFIATEAEKISEASGNEKNIASIKTQTNKNLYISEAIQVQIEVQRRLHEQLEVQRHLQLRIEAQGKYLQAVLEKAHETLRRQNLGTIGVEAAKLQLSELVSNQYLHSAFSEIKELQSFYPEQTQASQPTDCSLDSCLTSCQGSLGDQEMHNNNMDLGSLNFKSHLDSKAVCVEKAFDKETKHSNLSMSIGLQGGRYGSSSYLEKQEQSQEYKIPYFGAKLDLNTNNKTDAAPNSKQFDLNGFSWS